jgi:hypothetical protein
MSRRIDVSNPENLSAEDRQYLQDRGRLGNVQMLDYMARQKAAADAAVGMASRGTLQSRLIAQQDRQRGIDAPAGEMEEVDEPYDKWKVDDLRDECRARGLADDGKKDELVSRLMADDEQHHS